MSKKTKKSRAIIEDDDDDDDEEMVQKLAKSSSSKKVKKSKAIIDDDDDEANDSEPDENVHNLDEDDDDDDDEEEDEEAQAEEFNDFINDNIGDEEEEEEEEEEVEEEEAENPSETGSKKTKKKKKDKKKKKKKASESDAESKSSSSSDDSLSELSDDDLDLIKDNLNVDDLEKIGIKKRKRRIEVRSESSEDEKPTTSSRQVQKSERKKVKLPEDDEIDEPNELGQAAASDEEGSFIVDDTDDDDDDQANKQEKSKHVQKKKRMFNDDAQQEALDIFGVNAEELGVGSDDDQNDEDDEEAEEDDEDEDEEYDENDDETYEKATKKRQRLNRLKAMHKIEDIFEPQELEKNLLTEQDQQIRIEDKPERFMLRQVAVSAEPDEFELDKEADWIFNAHFAPLNKTSLCIQRIREVLNFIRNDFFEVPFIGQYRKEHYEPELNLDDLWKIYELDEKYCQLKSRKENLYRLLERMQKFQSTVEVAPSLQRRPLTDVDLDRVKNVQTVEEFLDCYHHFHLHYSSDLTTMKEFEVKENIRQKIEAKRGNTDDIENIEDELDEEDFAMLKFTKHASKKDRYNYCKSSGIGLLAAKFGLTPEKYGENLHSDYPKNELEQEATEPEMVAHEFVQEPFFQSVEQVLSTVRYMLAVQFAKEPSIRSYVRDLYNQRVCVNIRPTVPRGVKEIDENHAVYAFKYVKMKPVRELKDDEFLKMCQAEQDGLLVLKFELSNLPDGFGEVKKVAKKKNADDWDDDGQEEEEVTVEKVSSRTIQDKLKTFYQKDEFSYNVEQWNAQRAMIIDEMCTKFLFPDFERECKARLVTEAKQFVFRESAKKLEAMLKVAPYNPSIESIDDEEDRLRVMVITYNSDEAGEESTGYCCACVNTEGALDHYIYLKKLHVRMPRDMNNDTVFMNQDKKDKLEDMQRLEAFIDQRRPKVIVVSADNKDALTIQEDLVELVRKLSMNINVELLDNDVAKSCESSKLCQQEFAVPLPGLVRQAIYLARYIQDPMLCLSQLCNQDRDLLGLKLHPMMQFIVSSSGRNSDDSTQLLRLLETKFINIVNDVGVDLNRCDTEPHTSGVLQFVSGLGPRKAGHILKVLRNERLLLKGKLANDKDVTTYPVVSNRLYLVTKCQLGRRVFINCAGFIKLDVDKISKEIEEEEEEGQDEAYYTEPLDSTRIHLETYEWARKMAIDALDLDENSEAANSRTALKEILENPRRLKDLDLDAFADELMRTGHGNKRTTLYDIRQELCYRYRERRVQFAPMEPVEKFYCLIKETPDTFHKGKLITCRVTGIIRRRPTKEQLDEANPMKDENTCLWSCSFCKKNDFNEIGKVWAHFDTGECPGPPVGIRTNLENGCQGFIALRNLSDNQVNNPEDRIKIGMTIHARIRELDPEKFRCDLTSRTSDLRDESDKWKPEKDPYFDYRAMEEDKDKLEEKKKREEHRHVYTKRVISHPQFKNVGYSQAVDLLKECDIGDAIIRPSSKGNDHLTVTWKVGPNCFQHVDVLEEKKANSFSLGKKLIIQGEDYEDLDEILARFINPMAMYVREVLSNKYYKSLAELEMPENGDIKIELVEKFLLDERQKQPNKIPYVFLQCVQLPCKFMLAYMIRSKPRCEYLTITNEGFRFRQKVFRSFNELISWFKQHYNDPIPQSQPQVSSSQLLSQMNSMSVSNSQPMQTDDWDDNAGSQPPPAAISNSQEWNTNSSQSSSRGGYQPRGGGNRGGFSDRGRGDSRGGRGGFRGRGGFDRGGRGGGRGGGERGRGGFRGGRGGNNDYNRQSRQSNDDWDRPGPSANRADDDWDTPNSGGGNSQAKATNDDWNKNAPQPSYSQSARTNDDDDWDSGPSNSYQPPVNRTPIQSHAPPPPPPSAQPPRVPVVSNADDEMWD